MISDGKIHKKITIPLYLRMANLEPCLWGRSPKGEDLNPSTLILTGMKEFNTFPVMISKREHTEGE